MGRFTCDEVAPLPRRMPFPASALRAAWWGEPVSSLKKSVVVLKLEVELTLPVSR